MHSIKNTFKQDESPKKTREYIDKQRIKSIGNRENIP